MLRYTYVNSGCERKREDLSINFRMSQFQIGKLFIQGGGGGTRVLSDSEGIMSEHLESR